MCDPNRKLVVEGPGLLGYTEQRAPRLLLSCSNMQSFHPMLSSWCEVAARAPATWLFRELPKECTSKLLSKLHPMADLTAREIENTFFILGGLVPSWLRSGSSVTEGDVGTRHWRARLPREGMARPEACVRGARGWFCPHQAFKDPRSFSAEALTGSSWPVL